MRVITAAAVGGTALAAPPLTAGPALTAPPVPAGCTFATGAAHLRHYGHDDEDGGSVLHRCNSTDRHLHGWLHRTEHL